MTDHRIIKPVRKMSIICQRKIADRVSMGAHRRATSCSFTPTSDKHLLPHSYLLIFCHLSRSRSDQKYEYHLLRRFWRQLVRKDVRGLPHDSNRFNKQKISKASDPQQCCGLTCRTKSDSLSLYGTYIDNTKTGCRRAATRRNGVEPV